MNEVKTTTEEKIVRGIGILLIAYGTAVLFVLGFRFVFHFFSFVAGWFFYFLSYWKKLPTYKLPRGIRVAFMSLAAIGLCSFFLVEGILIHASVSAPQKDADYVLVLGSKVENYGPSRDFKSRLDSALEYAEENPECILIACGGQGDDEPMSEAQCAYDYFVKHGISEDRILKEDQSRNTFENITNAYKIVTKREAQPSECKAVIISANYHLKRARFLARQAGFENVSAKAAYGMPLLMPHYFFREFFAYIKDLLIHS